jgi:hypothetical protein
MGYTVPQSRHHAARHGHPSHDRPRERGVRAYWRTAAALQVSDRAPTSGCAGWRSPLDSGRHGQWENRMEENSGESASAIDVPYRNGHALTPAPIWTPPRPRPWSGRHLRDASSIAPHRESGRIWLRVDAVVQRHAWTRAGTETTVTPATAEFCAAEGRSPSAMGATMTVRRQCSAARRRSLTAPWYSVVRSGRGGTVLTEQQTSLPGNGVALALPDGARRRARARR